MSQIRPALMSLKDAMTFGGFGHTKAYELIALGKLDAVKLGAKTLITTESLDKFIASLPRADIRMKAQAAQHAA